MLGGSEGFAEVMDTFPREKGLVRVRLIIYVLFGKSLLKFAGGLEISMSGQSFSDGDRDDLIHPLGPR